MGKSNKMDNDANNKELNSNTFLLHIRTDCLLECDPFFIFTISGKKMYGIKMCLFSTAI